MRQNRYLEILAKNVHVGANKKMLKKRHKILYKSIIFCDTLMLKIYDQSLKI